MRWIAPFLLCGHSITRRARAFTSKLPYTTNLLLKPATLAVVTASPAFSRNFSTSMSGTGYLNAKDAFDLDVELMQTPGYSLEQLMELAGFAVAEAVYQVVPPTTSSRDGKQKILLVCGPGNNGGDGLVAARHLYFFGNYDCEIVYPKRSSKPHFVNLVKQCEDVGIVILDEMPSDSMDSYDAIVDAIFGFSFKGAPREPFATILYQLKEAQETDNDVQIISVDVPSGWNVDEGDVANTGFVPDVLISLTAPKLCTKQFSGRHFIGGRFLPPKVASKYNVRMPPYQGVSQVMEVTREHIEGESQLSKESSTEGVSSDYSWREEYAAYLAEQDQPSNEPDATSPVVSKETETDQNNDTSEETWEAQYAAHCAEKEARLAEEDAKRRETVHNERS